MTRSAWVDDEEEEEDEGVGVAAGVPDAPWGVVEDAMGVVWGSAEVCVGVLSVSSLMRFEGLWVSAWRFEPRSASEAAGVEDDDDEDEEVVGREGVALGRGVVGGRAGLCMAILSS